MKVSFLIDNALRESLVNVCIGELLNSVGVNYDLDNYNFFYSEKGYDFIKRTKQKYNATLMPSYNVGRTPEQLSRVIRSNSNIIATHAEQNINSADYEEKLNSRYPTAYNRHVSGHLVWGEFFSDLLRNHSNIPPDKIFITGNPKLDLSKRLKSTIDQSRIKKNVLIISDYTLGDFNNKEWAFFCKKYNLSYQTPLNHHYRKARNIAIQWVKHAAERYKGINFKFRIHPGESRVAYSSLMAIDNVKVTGEDDFIDDLLQSNLVFSYSSTSIFEVLVRDIQVYNLKVLELPSECKADYYELFEWIDKDQFLRILNDFESGASFSPSIQRRQLVNKYMYDGNRNAILRQAIAITEILKNNKQSFNVHDYYSHYSNLLLSILKDTIVKAGILLSDVTKIENPVSSFARKRQHQDEISEIRLKPANIIKSKSIFEEMDFGAELNILRNNQYSIRKENEGVFIDL